MAKTYHNLADARREWEADRDRMAAAGLTLPGVVAYLPEPFKRDCNMALDGIMPMLGMDAQPALATDPNSSVPAMLTTLIDPEIVEIRFAPNKAAEIFGEQRKGSWVNDTAMFPLVESTGEVSSYGDNNNNGRASANMNWPQRQQYRYQIIIEYGDLEMERAALGKINWANEQQKSSTLIMNKYENLVYFYGVAGLDNFGLLNDPGLSAPLTPSTKIETNATGWDGASANEIFDDIKSTVTELITQTAGLVTKESKMTLALGPTSEAQMAATNSFNVNVSDLLKKNYPNMTVKTAVQYEALSAQNPQGNAAGNLMQVIADDVDGQKVGYCSFGEKLKSFPIIRALSSYSQKRSGSAWGAIVRVPIGIAQMVGI